MHSYRIGCTSWGIIDKDTISIIHLYQYRFCSVNNACIYNIQRTYFFPTALRSQSILIVNKTPRLVYLHSPHPTPPLSSLHHNLRLTPPPPPPLIHSSLLLLPSPLLHNLRLQVAELAVQGGVGLVEGLPVRRQRLVSPGQGGELLRCSLTDR